MLCLWLCCRPVAAAPIRLLAWESQYAMDVALKRPNKTKQNKKKPQNKILLYTGNIGIIRKSGDRPNVWNKETNFVFTTKKKKKKKVR